MEQDKDTFDYENTLFITTSTMILMIAFLFRGLSTFIIRIIGASFLGLDEYGFLIILLSIVNTSYLFINANLDKSAMKFIPEVKMRNQNLHGLINAYLKGSLIFGSLITVFIGLLVFLLLYPGINILFLILLILFFPLSSIFKTIMGIFHGIGRISLRAVLEILYLVVSTVIIILAITHGVNLVIIGFFIGMFGALLVAYFLLQKFFNAKSSVSLKKYRYELYFGVGLTAATLGGALLQSIDVYMLAFLTTPSDVGLYGAAYTVALISAIPIMALSQVLIPVFSHILAKEGGRKEVKLYVHMMIVTLLLSLGLYFVLLTGLEFILEVFFPNQSTPVVLETTQMLLIGMFFSNLCLYNFSYMVTKGVLKAIIGFTWIQVVLFFVLNLILIPSSGIKGASFGFTISYVLAFVIAETYILKKCLGK